MPLTGVAVVTGGSGGIGRAVCSRLSLEGAKVASLCLGENPEVPLALRCDVTDEQQVARSLATVEGRLGPVSMLVCAAGVVSECPVRDLTVAEWHRVIDASLTGTFLASRATLPSMALAGAGRIVAFSSGFATKGYAGGAHYAAAKAGVEAFVKSLALEVASTGITVNAVAPGPVDTPMLRATGDDADRRRRIADGIPLGRIALPDDIVGAVVFLLGPDSAYVTGQVLHVNGGMLMP